MATLFEIIEVFGYRSEDDSWDTDGRRTYVCDEDADRAFLRLLSGALSRAGWNPHPTRLRTFQHWLTCELIEVEPGGDASGHYLHQMKPEVVS